MIHFQEDLDNYKSLALTAIQEAKQLFPKRKQLSYHDKVNQMKWITSVIADRHEVLSEIQRRYHNHDPYIFDNLMGKCKKKIDVASVRKS